MRQDDLILLDSRRTSPLSLSLRGDFTSSREKHTKNPDFADVSIQESGTCSNPVLVHQLPDVEILENTLEEVWDSSSTITVDNVISTPHGHVKGRDLQKLKLWNQINDVEINYIGLFLMSQKKSIHWKHFQAEEL